MTGTIINVIAVLAGGTLGMLLGHRLPKRVQETGMHGLSVLVIVIGISMALETRNILLPMFSVLLGAISGELLGIEEALTRLGQEVEARWGHRLGQGKVVGWNVTQAFVTTSILFCVGPMTILGSIQDGLIGDYHLLAIKSVLDGFAAIPFAATLGPGVLLSAGTVAVIQGSIAGLAMLLGSAWDVSRDTPWVLELTATGGVLVTAIGLNMLHLTRIRVANMLPAIGFAPLLVWLAHALGLAMP